MKNRKYLSLALMLVLMVALLFGGLPVTAAATTAAATSDTVATTAPNPTVTDTTIAATDSNIMALLDMILSDPEQYKQVLDELEVENTSATMLVAALATLVDIAPQLTELAYGLSVYQWMALGVFACGLGAGLGMFFWGLGKAGFFPFLLNVLRGIYKVLDQLGKEFWKLLKDGYNFLNKKKNPPTAS